MILSIPAIAWTHLADPGEALRKLVFSSASPAAILLIMVPDEDLYEQEKNVWPSIYNA